MRKLLLVVLLMALAAAFVYLCCAGKPVLYAPNIRVEPGSDAGVYQGILALDAKDGAITDDVTVVSGTFNPDAAGRYRIRYAVTDSDGKSASATRTITVSGVRRGLLKICLIVSAALLALCTLCLIVRSFRCR